MSDVTRPGKLKKARVTVNEKPCSSHQQASSHLGSTILIEDDSSDTMSLCDEEENDEAWRLAKPTYHNKINEKSGLYANKVLLLPGKSCVRASNISGNSKNIISSTTPGSSLSPQQQEDLKHCGVKDKMTKERYENKPGAIEVFCGCARMTKELQSVGFDAVGIDYRYNKDKPETKAYVELDLARPWGITELKKIIKDKKVKVAFIAPPCGSASAARLIRRKKGPDPKPLRSHRHPDGLPGLGLVDKQRVSTANKLYQAAADLSIFCQKNGISWVIENPTNSLMWETTPLLKLMEQLAEMGVEPKWTSIQMCMHGGD